MPWQLTLGGGEVPYPMSAPKTLNHRQRDLLNYMRAGEGGTIDTVTAYLFYADPTGALRRLEVLGLVEHVAIGKWRLTATPNGRP